MTRVDMKGAPWATLAYRVLTESSPFPPAMSVFCKSLFPFFLHVP